jgi:hypothetical protein
MHFKLPLASVGGVAEALIALADGLADAKVELRTAGEIEENTLLSSPTARRCSRKGMPIKFMTD